MRTNLNTEDIFQAYEQIINREYVTDRMGWHRFIVYYITDNSDLSSDKPFKLKVIYSNLIWVKKDKFILSDDMKHCICDALFTIRGQEKIYSILCWDSVYKHEE
jgi:hypothetical protein